LKIDILLSTYNGAVFLDDLIRSLYEQTYPGWHLFIRDDGSTDNTMERIESYRKKDKKRIFVVDGSDKNLGPLKSFEILLRSSEADYIMFCDQDDFWLPDKIQNTLTRMQELEQQHPGIPVLIFSDLKITDRNLNVIHPSYWKYTKVNPENTKNIYHLLVNNPVVGCTVMMNKKVKPLVLPFPVQAVMHDWWIALNVAQKGVMGYLSQPTILYRLHEKNSIGVTLTDKKYYARRVRYLSKTISQNRDAIKMLCALDFPLSQIKFWITKVAITFSKLF